MSSTVRFRFRNAVAEDSVAFDGSVIQIGDVKRLIAVKRGLGAEGAAELTLFDPSTNEEYADDSKVVPRNTLVLVKRAPVTQFKPLPSAAAPAPAVGGQPPAAAQQTAAPQQQQQQADEFGGDYYSEKPMAAVVREEEDRALQSLLQGAASTWQREVRQGAMRGRGRGRGAGGGGTPPEYRCPRWVGPRGREGGWGGLGCSCACACVCGGGDDAAAAASFSARQRHERPAPAAGLLSPRFRTCPAVVCIAPPVPH